MEGMRSCSVSNRILTTLSKATKPRLGPFTSRKRCLVQRYIKLEGTEYEANKISVDDLPQIDTDNCFVGPIVQLSTRGVVTIQIKNPRSGESMATIYALSVNANHLKYTELAQYQIGKTNAVFDQYLADNVRAKSSDLGSHPVAKIQRWRARAWCQRIPTSTKLRSLRAARADKVTKGKTTVNRISGYNCCSPTDAMGEGDFV